MAPDLPHNSWGIFKAKATPREAVGKIVICHHHSIVDGNFGNKRVTIRRFNFEKIMPDGALFDKIVVTLSPNATDLPVYALKDISSDAGLRLLAL